MKKKESDKVLEIGTGSIYQSSVLAEMGAWVFTIERQKSLYEFHQHFIFRKKYPTIKFFYGDGFEGLPSFAPFDKVIITAAAPFIPPKLVEQMKTGDLGGWLGKPEPSFIVEFFFNLINNSKFLLWILAGLFSLGVFFGRFKIRLNKYHLVAFS